MFTTPQGRDLSPDQARSIDDEFFSSRPFAYFASRIASLIEASSAPADGDRKLGRDIASILGLDPITSPAANQGDRQMQIAVDAVIVRHHAAEAVVSLYHALTVGAGGITGVNCVWETICDGPFSPRDLVTEANQFLASVEGSTRFPALVLPQQQCDGWQTNADTVARVQLMAGWLQHAMRLLVRNDIDLNAAHNKLKHGLAVRSHDDLRISFLTTAPVDGTIPVSAFTADGALDLIDTISLSYLSKPAKIPNSRRHGLEMSTLRLDPAVILAETWMIASTYGALFHVAAARHFDGRTDARLADYPRIPSTWPSPDQLLQGCLLGIRHPLTLPPDGGPIDRGPAFVFHDAAVPVSIDADAKTSAVIVDG